MRLFRVLPALSLLLGARASSLDSRGPTTHPLDARDLLDVCVSLNAELAVPDDQGLLSAFGLIDACVCLSALPVFITTNAVAILAVGVAGENPVIAALTALINNAAASRNCNYPEHSVPTCDGDADCAFTCTDGFTLTNSYSPKCTCPPPSVVCNGRCQGPGACPSANARVDKRKRWVGSGYCIEKGPGWAACGVYGGGHRAWECVNIDRDLESCGGCTLPLTPHSPIGRDCSALPGVADVSCLYGECVVYRCLPGYEPALDHHSCVRVRKYSQYDDAEDVPASDFGLEHVPLVKQ